MPNTPTNVADALNGILADSFALYLKTKNFHWHVWGPHFRDYHLLLDEQAQQILAATDPIAERVRKRGGSTLRSIGHVARLQSIADNDSDKVDAAAMLEELRRDNQMLAEALRHAKDLAEQERDIATSAMIDEWTDQAEERIWFLAEAVARG